MILDKLAEAGQFWLDVLFRRAESSRAKWAAAFLFAGLFVGGLLYWGDFLDWFNNRFDIQDWHVHVGPYLDFLSKSLRGSAIGTANVSQKYRGRRYRNAPRR